MNGRVLRNLVWLCLFLVLFFAANDYFLGHREEEESLHIALAAPTSGPDGATGQQLVDAVRLYLDGINKAGGIDGKPVVLDVFDDRNDPGKAQEKALEIIEQNRALAVIGHACNACSEAAGAIYRKYGIAAITPIASENRITAGNDWYFRTIYNEYAQGRALAHYAKSVLRQQEINLVSDATPYGQYLAKTFSAAAEEIGISTVRRWNIENTTQDREHLDRYIAEQIKRQDSLGKVKNTLIILAMQWRSGTSLIQAVRDAELGNPILVPDNFALAEFSDYFSELPNEKAYPDYYSNNLYVATPLIFDTANRQGRQFYEQFSADYGHEPEWAAAFAYDAAILIVNAIKADQTQSEGIALRRRHVRDYLAAIRQPEHAIEGVTGLNYFDEHGDAQKPIQMGHFKGQSIISALTQLKGARSSREISNLEHALSANEVVFVDQHLMYKTHVVYTGIEINKITHLDIKQLSYNLDFFLWFRFQHGVVPQDIEFVNALEPITLGEPVVEKQQGDSTYLRYHVKGRFKNDQLKSFVNLHSRLISVQFRHRQLSRDNLIYVIDVLGIGLTDPNTFAQRFKQNELLSATGGWQIENIKFYQDTIPKHTLGDPDHLTAIGSSIEHSRFNMDIQIAEIEFSLRELLPQQYALKLTAAMMILLLLTTFVRHRTRLRSSKLVWLCYVVFTSLLLLASESALIGFMAERLHPQNLKMFITLFDVLWWFFPAFFVTLGMEYFLWTPLENKTKRTIPTLVRRFVSFIIYLLALFGVVAFVFEQKLTGLLATSSVIAMIIGLAIQLNISHIFSGIALNLERAFSVGDWIKIEGQDEGVVIDMNWRTTRIRTRTLNIISIPNTKVAESVLNNYNTPSTLYGTICRIHMHPQHSPAKVIKVLEDAILSTGDEVLKDPPPKIFFRQLTEWSAEYQVLYFANNYQRRFFIRSEVWARLWHHLVYAGMPPTVPRQEVQLRRAPAIEDSGLTALQIIDRVEAFKPLPAHFKQQISECMIAHRFAANDTIFYQGDRGESLFIIVEGVVNVWAKTAAEENKQITQLGAGSYFGEFALLSSQPRMASVIALTDCVLLEITKSQLTPILQEQPELTDQLNKVLQRRRKQTQEYLARFDVQPLETRHESSGIFKGLTRLFK